MRIETFNVGKPLENYKITYYDNNLVLESKNERYYLKKVIAPDYYSHNNKICLETYSIHYSTLSIFDNVTITEYKILYLLYDYETNDFTPYIRITGQNNIHQLIKDDYLIIRSADYGFGIRYNDTQCTLLDSILDINPF
jgi:hypothetical protein